MNVKLEGLRAEAVSKRKRRRAKATRWKQANYIIGGLSAVLGVTAGAGVFADVAAESATAKVIVGGLALASGLLGALVGFYQFGSRSIRNMHEEGEWLRIEGQIDVGLRRWDGLDQDAQLKTYSDLVERYAAQVQDDARARSEK